MKGRADQRGVRESNACTDGDGDWEQRRRLTPGRGAPGLRGRVKLFLADGQYLFNSLLTIAIRFAIIQYHKHGGIDQ